MRIKELQINSQVEIIWKIIKEILVLFKVEIVEEDFQYKYLKIENTEGITSDVLTTNLTLEDSEGNIETFQRTSKVNEGESKKAGRNRLIKVNLYRIFTEELGGNKAPWGVLHGVRPTKIIHRYMQEEPDIEKVKKAFARDYLVSPEKTELIADIAQLQFPFLEEDGKKISIYVGIPFCPSRCLYCSFPSSILPPEKIVAQYLVTLAKEIETIGAYIRQYNLEVQSIYVGGGTPTSLNYDELQKVLELIKDNFYSPSVEEYTVEAGRPDAIDVEKIKLLAQYGVDRVSVNPQTMRDTTLKTIGRKHSSEDIRRAFADVRKGGIEHINADLIIGLPNEDVEDARYTIEELIKLEPVDITLHALAVKKGSALKMAGKDIVLPDDATVQAMSEIMVKAIKEYGLQPYYIYRQGYMSGQLENVGYCKPGQEGLYNIKIMGEQQTILGVGAAATTKVVKKGQRLLTSFNPKDLPTYFNSVDNYLAKRKELLAATYSN